LSGELSNSAKFFSSFADVSSDNANDVNASFGIEKDNIGQPWQYSERLREKLKANLAKQKLSHCTKSSRITTFISRGVGKSLFLPLKHWWIKYMYNLSI
jgi:hypothetical protein